MPMGEEQNAADQRGDGQSLLHREHVVLRPPAGDGLQQGGEIFRQIQDGGGIVHQRTPGDGEGLGGAGQMEMVLRDAGGKDLPQDPVVRSQDGGPGEVHPVGGGLSVQAGQIGAHEHILSEEVIGAAPGEDLGGAAQRLVSLSGQDLQAEINNGQKNGRAAMQPFRPAEHGLLQLAIEQGLLILRIAVKGGVGKLQEDGLFPLIRQRRRRALEPAADLPEDAFRRDAAEEQVQDLFGGVHQSPSPVRRAVFLTLALV